MLDINKFDGECTTKSNDISSSGSYFNVYDSNKIPTVGDAEWYENIKHKYKSNIANTFILTGNINDFMYKNCNLISYLKSKFVHDFGIKEICVMDSVYINNYHDVGQNRGKTNVGYRLDILSHFLENNNNVFAPKKALIIQYPKYLISSGDNVSYDYSDKERAVINLLHMISSDKIAKNGNIIVIISDTKSCLNSSLLSASLPTYCEEILTPNLNERNDFLLHLKESLGDINLNGIKNYEDLAVSTSGLSRRNLESIWREALSTGVLDRSMVKNIRQDIFKKEFSQWLDIYDPNDKCKLDKYGGMNYVKDYLKDGIIKPIQECNFDIVPKGLLFMGSCGTGKTFLAKCLASEGGISFVELKMQSLLSKWVGETEQNLEKALACIKSLAPVFVFIDEIDQVLQRGDNDNNSVRGNTFQTMMSFMSDVNNRGNIIFIGATNYPNKIDEAVKRAGRFDIKLVFTPPSDYDEICEVVNTILSSIEYPIAIQEFSEPYNEFIQMIDGYTQAEIESVLYKALSLCKRRDEYALTIDRLKEAVCYTRKSDNDEVKLMTELAIAECNDLEFIPKKYAYKYKDLLDEAEKYKTNSMRNLDKQVEEVFESRYNRKKSFVDFDLL